ncbi:MAG TPA: TIGR03086 family metal-binding protein [Streptosporangiaceae bacterium]|jgi:uncharacterized protein (TIGR03086 family)
MTEARAATTLFGGVALLERAVSYTLGPLGLVTPALLSRRTPCREWDLRTLLAHMSDSLAALHEALDLRQVDLGPEIEASPGSGPGSSSIPYAGGPDPAGMVSALRGRARALLGMLAGTHDVPVSIGGCLLPASIVTSVGAIDIAVHGWDVARACGAALPIPEPLAAEMLAISPLFVSHADRPSRFAAPVPVPAGASASDRLVAYLGRDPA